MAIGDVSYQRGKYKNFYPSDDCRCEKCGKEFEREDRVIRKDTQISWFRGEDEVGFYHQKCDPRKTKGQKHGKR